MELNFINYDFMLKLNNFTLHTKIAVKCFFKTTYVI